MNLARRLKAGVLALWVLAVILGGLAPAFSFPVEFRDSEGTVVITQRPSRVVSLVPAVTEILFAIGAGDCVKGISYHSTYPEETVRIPVVGGFLSPSLEAIQTLKPEVIFISDLHQEVRRNFAGKDCRVIHLESNSLEALYGMIDLLGKVFDQKERAHGLIQEMRKELQIVGEKVSKIPPSGKKRVLRLMGREQVMTPGDDSFQNEYIRWAGGIPPTLGRKGQAVPVTLEEWVSTNPQVIYDCGSDRDSVLGVFDRLGWNEVEAVKNGRILLFPCDLTCRASPRTALFIAWLSAMIYEEEFSREDQQVFKDHVTRSRRLDLPIPYVKEAKISESRIHDFLNKTLIIDFKKPVSIVSTLEGQRQGILSIGNHSLPPSCWGISHRMGLKESRRRIYKTLNKHEKDTSFLFTGVDMDRLAVGYERFQDMEVWAFVTAGIHFNAMRMAKDTGMYYEPGTINILLMSNMKLSPQAMTRAIVTATEAKTAALEDLDIRSSDTPLLHQATGTGTDNMIVVGGRGREMEQSGGHSKMGELIAKSVYQGVQEAVYRENGIVAGRNVFRRLDERKIDLFSLVSAHACECNVSQNDLVQALERLLLEPRYGAFLQSAMALSDSHGSGLFKDLRTYEDHCRAMAEEIGGKKGEAMLDLVARKDLPPVMKMALNALLNGLYQKIK